MQEQDSDWVSASTLTQTADPQCTPASQGGGVGGDLQLRAAASVAENGNARCDASGVPGWGNPAQLTIKSVSFIQGRVTIAMTIKVQNSDKCTAALQNVLV